MTLTLLSHNAYWFQGTPSLWGEERSEAHPDVLAALIAFYRQLSPDVLCLQEVPSRKICDEVAAGLGMRGHYARGGGRPTYGGAVLWRPLDGDVEDLTHTRIDGERIFERICIVFTTIVNGDPLVVVNVHLSSNRYAPDRNGEPVRLAELEVLFGACAQPDVVTGDFNARPDSAVYAAMIQRGYVDCGSQLSANRRDAERRVDYLWVREASTVRAEHMDSVPERPFALAGEPPVSLSDHPSLGVRLTW